MKHSRFQNRATAIRGVVIAGALAAFTTFAAWPGATAEAQAAACSGATSGAAADADQQAYVDVGVGNTATFVCITSTAFPGGQSAPITANGTAANGCFIVQGLNTSVVVVYRDWSVTSMNCAQLVRIDVGTASVATPTATATTTTSTATPTTPAATPTPTRTPTSPPATATQPPATPTAPAATATPTKPAVVPAPPKTGTGPATSDSGFPLIGVGFLVLIVGVAGATGVTAVRKANRS